MKKSFVCDLTTLSTDCYVSGYLPREMIVLFFLEVNRLQELTVCGSLLFVYSSMLFQGFAKIPFHTISQQSRCERKYHLTQKIYFLPYLYWYLSMQIVLCLVMRYPFVRFLLPNQFNRIQCFLCLWCKRKNQC